MSECATSSRPAGDGSTSAVFTGELPFGRLPAALSAVYRWSHLQACQLFSRRAARRLSVAETVSLGEKRFVSILNVDGEQFLLGGSSSNVVLLAKLEKSEMEQAERATTSATFNDVITRAGLTSSRNVQSVTRDTDGAAL